MTTSLDNPSIKEQSESNREILQEMESYGLQNPRKARTWNPRTFPENELPQQILKDPFVYRCFRRLHYENKNVLVITVGDTGAGKSISSASIARLIDITPLGKGKFKENFVINSNKQGIPTADCRIVFSAGDFIRLIRTGLPKGSVIIWDEAGIGNDNTRWYDRKSQIIKHIMQTFRKDNLMLILTVPDEESIALATRRLVHAVIEVQDRNNNFAICSVQWLDRVRGYRGKSGDQDVRTKIYRKTPAFQDALGQQYKVVEYCVPKIDKVSEDAYNRIKDRILNNMNEFYEREMDTMEKLEVKAVETLDSNAKKEYKKFDVLECLELVKTNKDYCSID